MLYAIVETPLFQSRWPVYRGEEERGAFAVFIAANPNAGDVAPASGGVRKVRWRRGHLLYAQRRRRSDLADADEELEAFEATCDVADDLLQAGKEMKAGLGQVVYSPLIAARKNTGLTRQQFAALLGISTPTLESWEQDRTQPIGAVRTLIAIALSHPEALVAIVEKELQAPPPIKLST